VSDGKVSTPEEVREAMEAYCRQTGHYPPAMMLSPDTMRRVFGAFDMIPKPDFDGGVLPTSYLGVALIPQPYLPLGMIVFCERDGSIPQAKPKPLLSFSDAELSVESGGKWTSLGKVSGFRVDDPEDILRISTYQPAPPEEIARRLTEEFGV
jgi:hypothetical protein